MRRALVPAAGARIAIASNGGHCVGITSFRIEGEKLKRINTGVLIPRCGIGTMLARYLFDTFPGLEHWCKSKRSANAWCESLGMVRGECVPELDATVYRWRRVWK